MKTKILTALVTSIVLAALACPVLASPIDRLVAGLPLDASFLPSALDAATVLGWSGATSPASSACPPSFHLEGRSRFTGRGQRRVYPSLINTVSETGAGRFSRTAASRSP